MIVDILIGFLAFCFILGMLSVIIHLVHARNSPDWMHSWEPRYFDKFGTGRWDQLSGYRCSGCGVWKKP